MNKSEVVVHGDCHGEDAASGAAEIQNETVAAVAIPSSPNEETKSRLEDDANLDHIRAAPVLVEAMGGILDHAAPQPDFLAGSSSSSTRPTITAHRRHRRRRHPDDHHAVAEDLDGSSAAQQHHGLEPCTRSNYGEERQPHSHTLDQTRSMHTASTNQERPALQKHHRFTGSKLSRKHETRLATMGLSAHDSEDGDDYPYKRRKRSHSKGRTHLAAHSVQREFAQQVSRQLVALEQTFREAMRERDDDVRGAEVDDDGKKPGCSYSESNIQSGLTTGYDGDGDDDDSSSEDKTAQKEPRRRK